MASWYDQEYFDRITKWIREADNGLYDAYKLSSDINKFVNHLKWYALKNKDARIVEIEQASESEVMYGLNYCTFFLADLSYPGVMAFGHLPEETRMHKMNRILSGKPGLIFHIGNNSIAPMTVKKLSEAKFNINDKVLLVNHKGEIGGIIKGFSENKCKNYYLVVLEVKRSDTARLNRYRCAFVEKGKKISFQINPNDIRWFFEYNLTEYRL